MNAGGSRRTAEDEWNNQAAKPLGPSSCKIDVGRYVAEMERILRVNGDPTERVQALAILSRWQFDEMLDEASRQRAKLLVLRFARDEWEDTWPRFGERAPVSHRSDGPRR